MADTINLGMKISIDANSLIDKFVSNETAIQELREKGITVNKHTLCRSGVLLIIKNPKLLTKEIATASQTEEGFDNTIEGEI
tara:strand:+ start:245 stop:490 length:246 start_codon:yes stop_codon:yes gene_type:complete